MTKAKIAIGVAALLGPLLTVGPVHAQGVVPQCGGQDATIVVTPETHPNPRDSDEWPVFGTSGNDVIHVSVERHPDAGDTYWTHVVFAGDGDDIVCTFSTEGVGVHVYGGAGNDTIMLGGSSKPGSQFRINVAEGGIGNDVLHGGANMDVLRGDDGADQIFGYQASDELDGGAGDDVITAGRGGDIVFARAGDDTVFGGPDSDAVWGGFGKDTLFGGAGHDIMFSNDDFVGYGGPDYEYSLEEGNDPPGPIGLASPTSYSQDTAGSRMFGGEGIDVLVGSNRWDRMQGGPGNDFLLGMEGRDWMRGGSGNDVLVGGFGIDDINGNLGADELVLFGDDVGSGGYGVDTCLSASGVQTVASCAQTEIPGVEWGDVMPRVRAAWMRAQ